MAERIELPPQLQGDEKRQLQQLWSYLYQLSESINNNLEGIGSNELTDAERATMQAIVGEGERQGLSEMESLKSLIIKTADFVQTSLTEYRLNLLGSTVASGQFGRYVRNTGLDVAVTPEGITQNYSFEEVVQGLKEFSINAKNYIKTGLLRVVDNIPVYGVAIGKDVVTFSQDGTETYNDGNKVAELTADELSFWQNGVKVAGYTGNRISFYYGGTEVFYIANGKVYCAQDLEITSGKKLIINAGDIIVDTTNFKLDSANKNLTIGGWEFDEDGFIYTPTGEHIDYQLADIDKIKTGCGGIFYEVVDLPPYGQFSNLIFIPTVYYENQYYYPEVQFSAKVYNSGLQGMKSSTDIDVYNTDEINLFQHQRAEYIGVKRISQCEYITSKTNTKIIFQLHCTIDGQTSIKNLNLSYDSQNDVMKLYRDSYTTFAFDIYCDTLYYYNLVQQSSRYVKNNIQNMESQGDRLDRLQPVTFEYKNDRKGKRRSGLIYEDTVDVMPEICTDNGGDRAINYVEMIPMLLKEIQDLRARVKTLEERTGG